MSAVVPLFCAPTTRRTGRQWGSVRCTRRPARIIAAYVGAARALSAASFGQETTLKQQHCPSRRTRSSLAVTLCHSGLAVAAGGGAATASSVRQRQTKSGLYSAPDVGCALVKHGPRRCAGGLGRGGGMMPCEAREGGKETPHRPQGRRETQAAAGDCLARGR